MGGSPALPAGETAWGKRLVQPPGVLYIGAMNTDARVAAAAYYRAAGRNMEQDLAALRAHPQGVVLMMPQLVVLMKPVLSHAPQCWPLLQDTSPRPDAWYVHLLAGDLQLARRLAGALPPLRWLCFQRGQRSSAPHRLPWAAFCQPRTTKLHGIQ